MRYEEFADGKETLSLDGDHLAGLYLALVEDEERLDRFQSAALEGIRALLYERLTIEQLESIREAYARRLSGPKRS